MNCPQCQRPDLTEDDFGVCRSRPSGLNLYCRVCIREKVYAHRAAVREYKLAHPSVDCRIVIQPNFSPRRIARLLRKPSPSDRVREAIRYGARTQKDIAQVTRLPKDEVCDALAKLLLWSREIRSEVINNVRMYFVTEGQAVRRQPVRLREPRSHGVSSIYFAA